MKKAYGGVWARLLLTAAFAAALFAGWRYYEHRQQPTPAYALAQIETALRTKDRALFERYVDVGTVLLSIHENTTRLLVKHIDALHARYPDDGFFRHDADFMQRYMEERRAWDIETARAMLDYYFDEKRVPVTRADGAAHWGADEMRAFAAHYEAAVEPMSEEGGTVVFYCTLRGDDSTYGRLLPEGACLLKLRKEEDGRYRLAVIKSSQYQDDGARFFAFIDAAERYWALQGWD